MEFWTEPLAEWQEGVDSVARYNELVERGTLLATWPALPFEETATECFQIGQEYWIWQVGVGGICVFADRPAFVAYPSPQVDRTWFDRLVSRSWLPTVYQIWGRQVLHASAVASSTSGEVVAFTGSSGAGKSTMAYGLGMRPRWTLICDDTLAFSHASSSDARRIVLHRLRNDARLRPASAEYYGTTGAPLEWPKHPLRLKAVYALQASPDHCRGAQFTRLRSAESYPLLLEQAYALTLKIPKHNQQLMRDYLELTASIPVFRLEYRKSFQIVEEVVDAVEDHLARACGFDHSATTLSVSPDAVGRER